jgi:spermidine synthase
MRFSVCDVQSRMQIGRPHDLMLAYTRLMMGFLLFAPAPRHIAMVGLGGGSLAKFCYRYLPDSRIQVIEINPYVIALRDEFEIPRDDHRFHVCKEDAADYFRTAQSRYDVIMADGFDANEMPADLGSRSFYDNCFDLLEEDGVLVVNLHLYHEDFLTYLERIKRSFAGRVVIVNDADLSNTIVFAFKQVPAVPLLTNLRRCATALTPEAWQQLAPSFSRIAQFCRRHSRG